VKGRNNLVASAAYRPEPAAVAAARKFVRETLQSWLETRPGPADAGLVDDAVLLTSELVTNAVVHAGTDIDLTLRLILPFLHIAVRDRGPGRPRITGPIDESAESGRGLMLVDAVAERWGTFYPETGKIVWGRVRVWPVPEGRL
jgi:anti-sigma regulatory factor (Ser/Thr protein kinase)